MGEKRVKIDLEPEVIRQIATRKALGGSLREIEAEFGFSRPVVNRALCTDMAKSVIKGLIDDAVASAVVSIRRRLSDMNELAMNVMEQNLKEGNIEALKLYFKGLGLEKTENEGAKQQQAIQVILPGSMKPEIKDV